MPEMQFIPPSLSPLPALHPLPTGIQCKLQHVAQQAGKKRHIDDVYWCLALELETREGRGLVGARAGCLPGWLLDNKRQRKAARQDGGRDVHRQRPKGLALGKIKPGPARVYQ